jgi:rhodanese-related sulfurtransferase
MPDTNPETTVQNAANRSAGTLLIDVREHHEWAAGHAPGATHIALGTLTPDLIATGASVLCICRSGRRSGDATARLRKAGIDAINVSGGMTAWAESGLPVVSDDGQPGKVI